MSSSINSSNKNVAIHSSSSSVHDKAPLRRRFIFWSAWSKPNRVIACALIMFALIDLIMLGMGSTFMRMEELSICRAHYLRVDPSRVDASGDVDERLCKTDEVQAKLAFLSGWMNSLESTPGRSNYFTCVTVITSFIISIIAAQPLPDHSNVAVNTSATTHLALLLSIPFGRLADRKGRKFVFALNLIPLYITTGCIAAVCYFYNTFTDPRILLLSPIGYLIGGGPQMLGTMLLTMVADVSSERNRSTIFMRFVTAQLFMELITTEAGSYLLARNLYLPLQIFVPVSTLVVPFVIFMPETLSYTNNANVEIQEDSAIEGLSLESRNDTFESFPLLTSESGSDGKIVFSNVSSVDEILSRILSINRMFSKHASVIIVLSLFFVREIDSGTFAHVLQFLSKRLSLTFAEAGKLVPVSAVFKLVILAYVIPKLTWVLRTRFHWQLRTVELFSVTASILAMMLGNIVVAFCSSRLQFVLGLFIMAFGCSLGPLLRSIATNLVASSVVAQLYSSITVVETVARLVIGPVFAYTFTIGLKRGILGLPFIVVAWFELCMIAVLCVTGLG